MKPELTAKYLMKKTRLRALEIFTNRACIQIQDGSTRAALPYGHDADRFAG